MIGNQFKWQEEYIAVTVSESLVDKVRKYIRDQDDHHKIKSFMDEYNEFMNKYGFNIISETVAKANSL